MHEDISEPDSQSLLAHVTKKKPLPPGNVKRLLSPAANSKSKQGSSKHPQEVNVNEITCTRQVNTVFVTYKILSTQVTEYIGVLIDKGANGGIAEDDVRINAKADRSMDIQAVNNHRINKNP